MKLFIFLIIASYTQNAQIVESVIGSKEQYINSLIERAEDNNVFAQESLANYYQYEEAPIHDIDQAIYWYEKAVDNGSLDAAMNLGALAMAGFLGNEDKCNESLKWFEIASKNNDPLNWINIAWLLVTCEDKSFRDGKRALGIMQKYADKTNRAATVIDTLAAVYAEIGNFEKAITLQETSLFLIKEGENYERIKSQENRLKLYKNNKTFSGFAHESPESYKD